MNKEFVGFVKVKEMNGPNGAWQYTQISFKDEDLQKLAQFKNAAGYVNLKLNRSQKGSEYLEIDTYGLNNNPSPQQQPAAPAFEPPPMPDNFNAPIQDEIDF